MLALRASVQMMTSRRPTLTSRGVISWLCVTCVCLSVLPRLANCVPAINLENIGLPEVQDKPHLTQDETAESLKDTSVSSVKDDNVQTVQNVESLLSNVEKTETAETPKESEIGSENKAPLTAEENIVNQSSSTIQEDTESNAKVNIISLVPEESLKKATGEQTLKTTDTTTKTEKTEENPGETVLEILNGVIEGNLKDTSSKIQEETSSNTLKNAFKITEEISPETYTFSQDQEAPSPKTFTDASDPHKTLSAVIIPDATPLAAEGRQLASGSALTAAMMMGAPLLAGALYAGANAPDHAVDGFEHSITGGLAADGEGPEDGGWRSVLRRTADNIRDTATYMEDSVYDFFNGGPESGPDGEGHQDEQDDAIHIPEHLIQNSPYPGRMSQLHPHMNTESFLPNHMDVAGMLSQAHPPGFSFNHMPPPGMPGFPHQPPFMPGGSHPFAQMPGPPFSNPLFRESAISPEGMNNNLRRKFDIDDLSAITRDTEMTFDPSSLGFDTIRRMSAEPSSARTLNPRRRTDTLVPEEGVRRSFQTSRQTKKLSPVSSHAGNLPFLDARLRMLTEVQRQRKKHPNIVEKSIEQEKPKQEEGLDIMVAPKETDNSAKNSKIIENSFVHKQVMSFNENGFRPVKPNSVIHGESSIFKEFHEPKVVEVKSRNPDAAPAPVASRLRQEPKIAQLNPLLSSQIKRSTLESDAGKHFLSERPNAHEARSGIEEGRSHRDSNYNTNFKVFDMKYKLPGRTVEERVSFNDIEGPANLKHQNTLLSSLMRNIDRAKSKETPDEEIYNDLHQDLHNIMNKQAEEKLAHEVFEHNEIFEPTKSRDYRKHSKLTRTPSSIQDIMDKPKDTGRSAKTDHPLKPLIMNIFKEMQEKQVQENLSEGASQSTGQNIVSQTMIDKKKPIFRGKPSLPKIKVHPSSFEMVDIDNAPMNEERVKKRNLIKYYEENYGDLEEYREPDKKYPSLRTKIKSKTEHEKSKPKTYKVDERNPPPLGKFFRRNRTKEREISEAYYKTATKDEISTSDSQSRRERIRENFRPLIRRRDRRKELKRNSQEQLASGESGRSVGTKNYRSNISRQSEETRPISNRNKQILERRQQIFEDKENGVPQFRRIRPKLRRKLLVEQPSEASNGQFDYKYEDDIYEDEMEFSPTSTWIKQTTPKKKKETLSPLPNKPKLFKSFSSDVEALREFKKMQEAEKTDVNRGSVERLKAIRDELVRNFELSNERPSNERPSNDERFFNRPRVSKTDIITIDQMHESNANNHQLITMKASMKGGDEVENNKKLLRRMLEVEPSNYRRSSMSLQVPNPLPVTFVDPSGRINNPIRSYNLQVPKPLVDSVNPKFGSVENLRKHHLSPTDLYNKDKANYASWTMNAGFNYNGDSSRNNERPPQILPQESDIIVGKIPKSQRRRRFRKNLRRRLLRKYINQNRSPKVALNNKPEEEVNTLLAAPQALPLISKTPTEKFPVQEINFYSGVREVTENVEPLTAGSKEFGNDMVFGENYNGNPEAQISAPQGQSFKEGSNSIKTKRSLNQQSVADGQIWLDREMALVRAG